MLTMKMSDGSSVTVTGKEAKEASASLSKVIYEHSKIAAIHKMVKSIRKATGAIKKDTHFLVNTVPTRIREDVVRITIDGARLDQFNRVKLYMRQHTGHPLYQACRCVWRKTENGYPTARSLYRFCLDHYGMLA